MKLNLAFGCLVFFLVPSFGFAGGSVTGDDGGHGVLCQGYYRDSNMTQAFRYHLELLDFYEARTVYRAKRVERGHRMLTDVQTKNRQFEVCAILKSRKIRMQKILGRQIGMEDAFDKACKLVFSARGAGAIQETKDEGELAWSLPSNCEIVQIAKRTGSHVFINDQLLELLTVTDMSALLLHEELHPYFEGNFSTLAVRQFVMFTFAKESFVRRNEHLLTELIQTRRPIHPSRFSCE